MMRPVIIALAILACAPAAAEDRAPTKLSIDGAIELFGGLKALDGRDRVVKDGDRERIVSEPYKLGGGLRLAIAKNMAVIRDALAVFEAGKVGLINEISKGAGAPALEADKTMKAAFEAQIAPLARAERDMDLVHIKTSELRLEENQIPGSVLYQIRPILDE